MASVLAETLDVNIPRGQQMLNIKPHHGTVARLNNSALEAAASKGSQISLEPLYQAQLHLF